MTADEFEQAYAARSGVTVAELRANGLVVRPCYCTQVGCEGWQSVSQELAALMDMAFARAGRPRPEEDDDA